MEFIVKRGFYKYCKGFSVSQCHGKRLFKDVIARE
jgi:hypothetical protein